MLTKWSHFFIYLIKLQTITNNYKQLQTITNNYIKINLP